MIIGRFAPSPSGRMHLGNLFAALMAYLSVRSQNGEMVLRIEDLDRQRCSLEKENILKEDLLWLGLSWDREMPPQRDRTAFYETVLAKLVALGHAYPCWCSRSDLKAASAPHASDGHVIYPGTCYGLSPAEQAAKTTDPLMRMHVPDRVMEFYDRVYGTIRENLAEECGDFVLRRADGLFAYQLAVVADDMDGGITEVVRGRDLITSTARQMYLIEVLGGTVPAYAHVPLLVAPDGRKLSKREKDLDMGVLRQTMKPEELLGLLAYTAGLIDRNEAVSLNDLIKIFSWDTIKPTDSALPDVWQ